MPFLSIFRKDKDTPRSPVSSRHSGSFSRAKSRPSVSSRSGSPPPQLANISPVDLDYVLPELDELEPEPETVKRRGLLRRRRESTEPVSPRPFSPPRPFSEALARDSDLDPSNNAINNGINSPNTRSNSNNSDDDPLVPPPPRASVFAGFTYTDKERSSQSLPEHSSSTSSDMAKTKKKDGPRPSGGLFGWRSKSSKEVPTTPTPDPDASFSLKSFRHVGPAPESPASPTNTTPPAMTTPPSSFSRATDPAATPTARPAPGRSAPAARDRVNSTGSEGMMTAGLFRQAARRSSTNLVEDAVEPVKPRIRDNEKRGPPTRPWDTRDDAGAASSGSERPPRSIRPRPSAANSESEPGSTRVVSRSSSAIPYVGPRKSMAPDDDDSAPESPSPFAGRLGDSGRESPFATRSDHGTRNVNDLSHIPRVDYSMYGARSDGGIRRPGPRPSSPAKLQSSRPSILSGSTLSSSPPRLSLGLNSPPSPTSPKRGPPPSRRPNSPTKPRHSAPTTRPTRSPIRTTIPTKTNDGPTIKPGLPSRPTRPGSPAKPGLGQGQGQGLGHGRRPSAGEASMRSVSVDVTPVSHARRPSAFEVVSRPKSPGPVSAFGSRTIDLSANGSVTDLARPKTPGADYSRPRTPSAAGEIQRAKSPAPTVDSTRAKSPAPTVSSIRAQAPSRVPAPTRPGPTPISSGPAASNTRAPGPAPANNTRAPGPAPNNTRAPAPGPTAVPRTGYVPPPRASSLAPTTLVDSDSDESPEETESGSDEFGYSGAKKDRGAVRGKVSFAAAPDEGLSRERTITQRDRASPVPPADAKPAVSAAPPRIGVSLFDKPMPKFDEGTKFSTPPRAFGRTRASNSTSAISEAAKARNSAAMAEANRAMAGGPSPGKHSRSGSLGVSETLRTSHIRAPAVGTDTDEDEDDEEKSDSESDDAPLSSLAPARRPGSSASTAAPSMARSPAGPPAAAAARANAPRPSLGPPNAPRPSLGPPLSRSAKPLIDMAGVAPPPRPARRVPGVGVTRTSSLKGSRSVEDLGRMTMAKSAVGRPGPRPFVISPPSSTGDSSSGKAPLTPRDGSESGARRPGSDEARRKERRRSEAKASVDLANVINGPGPVDNDDEDEHMSAHHSQLGHGMGMGMGMGWNGSGFFPPQGGFAGFPASQSMPFLHPQLTGPAPMGFMPPPPPPGANEAYLAAHQQAMMIAKQTYLSAVAQQAMAAAGEQWERSSVAGGGSVYGGSQMSMMGMPMMGMYSHSAYAASSYEPSVVGGWGSASAYGGPARSVYGGPGRTSPTKSAATARNEGHGRTRSRTHTSPSDTPKPPSTRTSPVPPSTWATRGKRM